VPYKEKNEAKALGARWDRQEKRWFAPEGTDLSRLQAWLPTDNDRRAEDFRLLSPQDEFALALRKAGLDLQGQAPLMDGESHRVPLFGGKADALDGAYCADADKSSGWARNLLTNKNTSWTATGHILSEEHRREMLTEHERQRAGPENSMGLNHEESRTFYIDTATYTDDERDAFVSGWEYAGGTMGDVESSTPWCCPWYHSSPVISVEAGSMPTPTEAGALWWAACRQEIEQLLEAEEANLER
jgi:hypothetical protein